ncbi:MAG: FAD-dependent oxidoreductase, partial [Elusimicrobiaceae bacterium]|nr:FAD-dependent oxidoreductase [Elusimicrobiaceae bacterium]
LGGGNSAMDAARCAMRLGPESVTIVYRRGKDGLPAREEEIENAEEEGIKFQFLTVPKEIVADEDGKVAILKCLKTELGEPDASGRRRPQVIEGSGFDIKTDSIIIALGQSPNPIITNTNPDLKTNKWGAVELNEAGETSLKGVYAGGDITRGGATVLLAMKDGIEAAEKMHKYLETKGAK